MDKHKKDDWIFTCIIQSVRAPNREEEDHNKWITVILFIRSKSYDKQVKNVIIYYRFMI